ncbi:hypothetical protein [Staphylospora marina]|uniref:hypothetical protein n=1 Tax=Staphylospora marina TaxID=2490858 RepID=UPI000F5BB119|nr:hypothetical protein [Staphylospora marina]
MALFEIKGTYRKKYRVEHVVRFFDGELAVAFDGRERVYLQSAALTRLPPSRAIQQYRTLHHPKVLPYVEVYTEESHIVWVRPYEPIRPLRDLTASGRADAERVIAWIRELSKLEADLEAKPIPMYLLRDPRNVGVNVQGDLQVFFCGIRDITSQPPLLDWGSFFYCLLTGRQPEESLKQLPDDAGISGHLAKLVGKCLGVENPAEVLEHIERYERKKQGKGILGIFFGQDGGKPAGDASPERPVASSREENPRIGNDDSREMDSQRDKVSAPLPPREKREAADGSALSGEVARLREELGRIRAEFREQQRKIRELEEKLNRQQSALEERESRLLEQLLKRLKAEPNPWEREWRERLRPETESRMNPSKPNTVLSTGQPVKSRATEDGGETAVKTRPVRHTDHEDRIHEELARQFEEYMKLTFRERGSS